MITGGQLKNLELFFPSSLEEQQKIASCLSSLDEIIQAQAEKIELLKQHKKGLLQGLFPNINEENG
ncbi:MAG: restriction endonuclease subunit S [Leptospiraceae bacterium]|nr:restriction endonuclease subunit S [Leptospiraceae bacterium]